MKRLPLYLLAIVLSAALGAAVSRYVGQLLFLSGRAEVITLGVVLSLIFAGIAIALLTFIPKR